MSADNSWGNCAIFMFRGPGTIDYLQIWSRTQSGHRLIMTSKSTDPILLKLFFMTYIKEIYLGSLTSRSRYKVV